MNSFQLKQQTLLQQFDNFTNWQDKYRFIMQSGKQLPEFAPHLKIESNQIFGCESKVWVSLNSKQGKLLFTGDSDARVTKGLLFVIHQLVDGSALSDINGFNYQAFFTQLGLIQHLSPTRGNGLLAITQKINTFTQAQLD